MEQKAAPESSIGDEGNSERELSVTLDGRLPRGICLGFDSLPENLRPIVADCISDDKKDPRSRALLGEPHFTLCLSQHPNLKLGSCWHFGCLSPKDRWESSMKVKVDMDYLIKDYESCLDYLGRENSPYCPISVEVLVFQVDVSSQDGSSTLDDLKYTLTMLQGHLKRLQHVVFAINKRAFCCFSLKDVIDDATSVAKAVDRLYALQQILGDLRTCWKINQSLGTRELLDYYILKDVKPDSEKYLSNFVIALYHPDSGDFLDVVSPALKSSKLKRIYCLETLGDVAFVNWRVIRDCHAIHLDASKFHDKDFFLPDLERAFSLEDNTFIERIAIKSHREGFLLKLPQPTKPLTATAPLSALVELSLKTLSNRLDLSQLNNGFFPHLAHLCVIGGEITGHLDSQSVPSLKTLILQLQSETYRSSPILGSLLREHTQSLIDTGRPWQIVALPGRKCGWSLASYDETTPNPHDDGKEDASSSRPLIRELMLVMETQEHANEWQSRLSGNPPLEAGAGKQNAPLLVWEPDRVEKITVFSSLVKNIQLSFTEGIPGKTRILSSLVCHDIRVVIDGTVLPNLKLLEVNWGSVTLSGSFPQLQTLSFRDTRLGIRWKIDAPALQSFSCLCMQNFMDLYLSPDLLPHLSYLQIELDEEYPLYCFTIVDDQDGLGLSRVKHVVLDRRMAKYLASHQWQVQNVSHLELTVDAGKLPEDWLSPMWLCETLTINVCLLTTQQWPPLEAPGLVVLPELPLVKKLTVTEEKDCQALLDTELPVLTDCTMPTPRSLGPKLKCPALRCIRFTGNLSESEKDKCLNPATYEAMSAHPEWVYFDDGEIKRMSWDVAPSAAGVSSFEEPLEDDGKSSVTPE